MTYEIKKQQIIDQQIFESNDLTKFSLNQEYNFAKDDLLNKTDEHESDNRPWHFSNDGSGDNSADGNQMPCTESSDWYSNSSCSSDYSCFSEDGSLLMDLEIPLTENEEKLIDEFCKEMKDKIEENEREYKRKISNQESIENWTEGALKRMKSVVDTYLERGIRLNSCYGDRYRTVTNLIFEEIIDVINNKGLCPSSKAHAFRGQDVSCNNEDQDDDNTNEVLEDGNLDIIRNTIRDLLLKGGKVERGLFDGGELGHITSDFDYVNDLFAECKEIENDLKNVAYESTVNKNEQAQKDKLELKVEIDNECFCIKYSQDSTVEVAKILSNEKNKGLNLRVGILQIGKSIIRVESYNGKRNYLDVLKQGVTLSFDSEAEKISIHLNPKENSNEIEVKLDESSEEVFEKLKKSGLSLGENCLLGGKSVLEAIQDGNFERNRSIIPTSVIEQPNAATNTPQSYLENIRLNGHNDRTKRIDSRHG
ncbi:hypothetical protein [Wolbachia endosymbiont (group A) of Sicus ferrugineus]|uniref:hypothetical protein n=1 Tax=Wolbachia endosymbiont (group A) of Sicus ferrugineus TaxID=2954056 RepID=UPI00222F930B|nr:hypothetical protein [Wolbachia endosymbiont (group A) of Sicus ferrugineus]